LAEAEEETGGETNRRVADKRQGTKTCPLTMAPGAERRKIGKDTGKGSEQDEQANDGIGFGWGESSSSRIDGSGTKGHRTDANEGGDDAERWTETTQMKKVRDGKQR
jgi:hypothetical protein